MLHPPFISAEQTIRMTHTDGMGNTPILNKTQNYRKLIKENISTVSGILDRLRIPTPVRLRIHC